MSAETKAAPTRPKGSKQKPKAWTKRRFPTDRLRRLTDPGQLQLPESVRRAVSGRFKMHTASDPAPEPKRLALASTWAAFIGLGGMVLATPLVVHLFRTTMTWYLPTALILGAIGIGATVGAFASIHRRRMPFYLLGVASVALLAGAIVTAVS